MFQTMTSWYKRFHLLNSPSLYFLIKAWAYWSNVWNWEVKINLKLPFSIEDSSEKSVAILLTHHWLTIIGADNGLSPGRRQAIIWTNAGILLIEPLGTNFSEILIRIKIFSFNKMRLKMSSAKWRPLCLGLNVLNCNSATWIVSILAMILPPQQ